MYDHTAYICTHEACKGEAEFCGRIQLLRSSKLKGDGDSHCRELNPRKFVQSERYVALNHEAITSWNHIAVAGTRPAQTYNAEVQYGQVKRPLSISPRSIPI
jgi:hypothetical protein